MGSEHLLSKITICCNSWKVYLKCYIFLRNSPVIASEFGNVNVANLIEIEMKNNLSNQNSNQNMIVSTYHIFVASRIVFLWETCCCDYRIPIFTWGLMKYLLGIIIDDVMKYRFINSYSIFRSIEFRSFCYLVLLCNLSCFRT